MRSSTAWAKTALQSGMGWIYTRSPASSHAGRRTGANSWARWQTDLDNGITPLSLLDQRSNGTRAPANISRSPRLRSASHYVGNLLGAGKVQLLRTFLIPASAATCFKLVVCPSQEFALARIAVRQ